MAFDVNAALQSGYTEKEIAEFLGAQNKFNTSAAIAAGYTPKEIIDRFASPATERSFGEAVKDVGAGVVSGVGSLVQLPGQLYGLATGNMDKTGLLGAGEDIQKYGQSLKSSGLKAREIERSERIAEAEKKGQFSAFLTSFGETIKDPALLTNFLAEQVPQLLVPGGAASLVGRSALKRGLAAGVESTLAKEAAIKAGTSAAIGAGAVQQGADIGAQTYQDAYAKLIEQGRTEPEAAGIAINLARASGASAAIISLLAQRLPGARALEEALAGKVGVSGVLVGGVKGVLGESASESVEEGGGKFIQNLAMQQIDPTQSLMQGVGATAGQAAVAGAVVGGGAGAISGLRGNNAQAILQAQAQVQAQEQAAIQQQAQAQAQAQAAQAKATEDAYKQSDQYAIDLGNKYDEVNAQMLKLQERASTLQRGDAVDKENYKYAKQELDEFNKTVYTPLLQEYAPLRDRSNALRAAAPITPVQPIVKAPVAPPEPVTPPVEAPVEPTVSLDSLVKVPPIEAVTEVPVAPAVEIQPIDKPSAIDSTLETISNAGSDELIASHSAAQITDQAAVQIAQAAPNDSSLQAVGMRQVLDGKPIDQAVNTMLASKLMVSEGQQSQSGDRFDFDKAGLETAQEMAKIASSKQREVNEKLSAVRSESERPELAAKEGVNVNDPVALDKRIKELETRRNALDNWTTSPELVQEIRKSMTPSFARESSRPASSMPISSVQKVVSELTAKWRSGPAVRVVATPKDLPVRAPSDAKGLIYKDTTYVVASNHTTRDGIARTLAHEAIGHYGLLRMLGPDGLKTFVQNIKFSLNAGNKPIIALRDQVRKTYVDENGKFNLNEADEAYEIASAAVEASINPTTGEFNPGFGFVKRVYAKIADFLRGLGIDIKFTNTELQGMLVASMRGLEAGRVKLQGNDQMIAASRDNQGELLNSYTPDEVVIKTEKETAALKKEQQTDRPVPSKKITTDQVDLFNPQGGLFSRSTVTPTSVGQQALANLEKMGREVKPPEAGNIAKARGAWDNARDNPKVTIEAANASFQRFGDSVQTMLFSSDAALNNQIKREVMDSAASQKEKIGLLLNTSLSQTFHSDAVANLFLRKGDIKYNADLHKWEGVESKNNFLTLAQSIDKVATKYGLTMEQAELVAHTAFEAKRTKSLVAFNEDLKTKTIELRAAAADERKKGNAVKASALSAQASAMSQKEKFIHMSDEDIQIGLSQIDLMPELKDSIDIWNGIRENTVQKLIETGLWSETDADFLLSNADYVPFYREEQLENGNGPKGYIGGLQVQAKERRLKGSSKPVNNIFDNMVNWTQYSVNRAVRNRSALSLAETAESVGLATKAKNIKDGNNVVRVWKNGEEAYFDMKDPLFMSAFQGLESVSIPTIKFFSKFADILRNTVVLNPLFAVTQLPQDSFAAMFSSGLKPQFALTIPFRAVKEFLLTLANKSKAHEELKNVASTGVKDFSSSMIRLDAKIAAGLKPSKGLWGKVKDSLGHIAMASDNAVRQATYEAAMSQGLSRAEAIEKSFEIFNVRRRGTSKMLNIAGQVIPFFYAYLAAQNVLVRTITGTGTSPTQKAEAYKALISTSASVFALSVLYAMMNGDDEDYINKPTPTRDRLMMIPGTGMAIPLRADLFTLPKVIAEHTYLLLTNNGYADPAKFRSSVASVISSAILSPTPVPQAIKPLIEVAINYNFFQQKPLIGTFQQKKDIERQFEDSTSELGKLFGKTGLISPIGADHIIRGMFGSAGGMLLYATNPFLWNATSGVSRPSLSIQDALATVPNASGLITKEYESGIKKDFFALKEVVDKASSTLTDMKQRSPLEAAEYVKDEKIQARLGLSAIVANINSQLSMIRKNISAITNSGLSADAKEEKIKNLKRIENNMMMNLNLKSLREKAMM